LAENAKIKHSGVFHFPRSEGCNLTQLIVFQGEMKKKVVFFFGKRIIFRHLRPPEDEEGVILRN